MTPGTIIFRILAGAFLAWTLYKMARAIYHFLHRRTLRRTGYIVRGEVVALTTLPSVNRGNRLATVVCRIRYIAKNGQAYQTSFTTSYTLTSVPRVGDVTDVYVSPIDPEDAEADRHPRAPSA